MILIIDVLWTDMHYELLTMSGFPPVCLENQANSGAIKILEELGTLKKLKIRENSDIFKDVNKIRENFHQIYFVFHTRRYIENTYTCDPSGGKCVFKCVSIYK